MITIWMAVSLGGGTAFFYVLFKVFSCMQSVCCSSFIKKKKTSSYIRRSHKVSTSLAVLQYFPESTGVLPLQYCGTFLEVLVL